MPPSPASDYSSEEHLLEPLPLPLLSSAAAAASPPPGALDCSDAAWRRGRCACSARRAESCSALLLLLAGACALALTLGHDALAALVRAGVAKQFLVDSPQAAHFASFLDSNDPKSGRITSSYTLFNCTNAADVVLRGAKPRFELVGPVAFHYRSQKFGVEFDERAETVAFREAQFYEPATDADAQLMQLPVVGVDLVLLAALNPNQPLSATVPVLFPQSLEPGALFLTRSAREWIFGFPHPYLPDPQAPLSGRPALFPGISQNDSSVAAAIATHGVNRVATGRGDAAAQMQFLAYDGATSTSCCRSGLAGEANATASGNCGPLFGTWAGDAVRGSIGTQFHQEVEPSETLLLGTYDFGMLRAWPMVCGRVGAGLGPGLLFDGSDLTARIGGCDSYDVQGIRLNRYVLPSYVMGNASVNAGEAAAFGNADGPSGLMNQTNCEQYAPLFISRPFFLYASDSVRAALERLPDEADEKRHGSFLALEPVTGRVLDFAFRMQANALVRAVTVDGVFEYFGGVAGARSGGVYVPLLWGEQRATVTAEQALDLTGPGGLYSALYFLAAVRWLSTALGAALLLAAMWVRSAVVPRLERAEKEGADEGADPRAEVAFEDGGGGNVN